MRLESPSVIEDVTHSFVMAPTSTTHLELQTKIAEQALGVRDIDLTHLHMDPRKFTVGEFCPRFMLQEGETLEGKTVVVEVTPGPHKEAEALSERACMCARAAKENGAKKVVLLSTDLTHARQDRGPDEDEKARGELNTVRWHAQKYHLAGIDQVITTHLHSPRIYAYYAQAYGLVQGKFDSKDEHIQELGKGILKSISPHTLLADYLLHHSSLIGTKYFADGGALLALEGMDRGNWSFVDLLFNALWLQNAVRIYCNKARKVKNDPNGVEIDVDHISDNFDTLQGKLQIYADDGTDTGGTFMQHLRWALQGSMCSATGTAYGVPEDRLVYFSHPWLSGKSHLSVQEQLVKNLPACEFVTTNTWPYISDEQYYRFKEKSTVLRFAKLWADALIANELGQDVEKRYRDFSSEEEQHEFLNDLYVLKRHSRHFLAEGNPERRKIEFKIR